MDSGNDHSWQETLFRNISFKEQEHGHEDVVSPMATRTGRRSSVHFDATSTIQRLRSSMVGLPQLYTAATVDDIVSDSSADSVPDASSNTKSSQQSQTNAIQWLLNVMGQIPAITLIAIFHLMIGIPFGVSYFPMSWNPYVEEANDEEGPFPLPGKEALGIRMFLFSTMIGQIVFTMTSKFSNPIGLQMVENVPFCHELAQIVIQHQGYGLDALSTLFVMFGLSSVLVGLVFYVLGKRNLGRVVYFFPTHVLIGCIGGIGVFLAKTGVEVTIANVFSVTNIIERWTVLWVAVAFEIVLRGLEKVLRDENGQPLYSLLSPIYFCMITPMFYFGLKIARLEISQADDMGFFFPPLDNESSAAAAGIGGSSVWYENHIWDMWTVIDIPTVSWAAIRDSLPTLLALSLFSLIHVPINIPAFALSTNTEADMNNELVSHGYSNIIVGLFGGLQNYMAYTQSVIYAKSNGEGKASGFGVAAATGVLFFIGPAVASYIPRCMAGTLLLHVGIDLFVEGVWDTYGKFDLLEYSGILLIVLVMTLYGMEAAMMAGVIAAVSTYAVQSVAYLSPIRGSMPATTLRSSQVNRSPEAFAILNSTVEGRSRILVIQLQGHLFFGNMATFTDTMHQLVRGNEEQNHLPPVVIIMDCSLVLGIDSSAAQAISKLKDSLLKKHQIDLFIFVTGSDQGFPTQYPLTDNLSTKQHSIPIREEGEVPRETTPLFNEGRNSTPAKDKYRGSHVSTTLDDALTYGEDALISRANPLLLKEEEADLRKSVGRHLSKPEGDEEKNLATAYLRKICSANIPDEDAEELFSRFTRQVYKDGDYLWHQHSESDCAKLLVSGMLMAKLENEAGTSEYIFAGNLIGEMGLVNRDVRMSSVQCVSDEAILYSLSRDSFEDLMATHPRVARYIDLICIKYLALRVQHVSNRIFETRCLPI